MLVSPSLLAADFTNLCLEISRIKNADMLHLDVMDGVFVPNISIGQPVIKALRSKTDMVFDVHLMIDRPLKYIKDFAEIGSDIITVHTECSEDTGAMIDEILSCGKKAGLAIKPNTPVRDLTPHGDKLYMVTVMTVEPGFGGQGMIVEALSKVKEIKSAFPRVLVEVDGGVTRETALLCKESGVDILVAGTAVFAAENPEEEIRFLQEI